MTPSPPRRPSRLTWPVLSRLLGRSLAGLALVWMVALVAWPERRVFFTMVDADGYLPRRGPGRGEHVGDLMRRSGVRPQKLDSSNFAFGYRIVFRRDSSLSVLLGKRSR